MAILLIADHDNGIVSEATARALTAALQIGGDVHVLVAGHHVADAAADAARLLGIAKVLVADDVQLDRQLAEPLAELIVSLCGGYEAVLAPATARSKATLPRVAALLDVMQISEIMAVLAPDTFRRAIYAGAAIQTVQSGDAVKVITVRGSAFAKSCGAGSAETEVVAMPRIEAGATFIAEDLTAADRPNLLSARIVVSGGRGLGTHENFEKLLAPLADKLGAAIGASRAAVDAGFAPSDWLVGQTGKSIAPDLYIACGISGAVQHLAGMKEAKVVVAINSDPEAPIFQIADYGLVANLAEALPELTELI